MNGEQRWCLWLVGAEPSVLRTLPTVLERVAAVQYLRLKSSRPNLANSPHLFAQITQPVGADYILIPRHTSENRMYIPMGLFTSEKVAADSCLIVPHATLFHFGILTSTIHMSWVRYVCGRLKSDYRYSKDLVYNNFPWPEPTQAQRDKVEALAQGVLDARANHPTSTLADLYHPTTMPPDLRKAHDALDKAVDQCYRKESFASERERVEYLFDLYRKITEGFGAEEEGKKRKGRK